MTTYYANFDLTTGNNTGVDATNAWKTFADVLAGSNGTAPVAGDTVLCKGTDTLGAAIDIAISGSYANGYIKFIGVDASWNNVGGSTKAIFDANDGAYDVLREVSGADFIWFENFTFQNTNRASGNHGVDSATLYADYWVFKNCDFTDCYAGFTETAYMRWAVLFQCRAYNNANNGFSLRGAYLYFCRAYSNGARGISMSNADTLSFGCIAHDNATAGIYTYGESCLFCVSEDNTTDGIMDGYQLPGGVFLGNRSTNNGSEGFVNGHESRRSLLFYYYGDNNDVNITGNYDDIKNIDAATVTLNGSDTNQGYVDPANDDYNLRSDATYRREKVTIP